MKIDFNSIDKSQFDVSRYTLFGEIVYLVTPLLNGVEWNQENKVFRSSLYNEYGELISASFPKFTNFLESQNHFPVPKNLDGCSVVSKMDGSAVICSTYNGKFIARTRGAIGINPDYDSEVRGLIQKYNINGYFHDLTSLSSLIFEYTSDKNKIVISYPEPDLTIIGKVNHEDYSLATQDQLDEIAAKNGWKRPERYKFGSIPELISAVEKWQDREGICLYSNGDQSIHKIKAFSYLVKHRFKSDCAFDNVLNLFLEFGRPDYESFKQQLIEKFDFECFSLAKEHAKEVCDYYLSFLNFNEFNKKRIKSKQYTSRKEAAKDIIKEHGNLSCFIFNIMDNKEISDSDIKKYIKLI